MNSITKIDFFLSLKGPWPSDRLLQEALILDQDYFPTPWASGQWRSLGAQEDYLLGISHHSFILFKLSPLEELAHLLKIIVHPEKRGQKKGHFILEQGLKKCLELNMKRVYLEVEETNTKALSLYLSFGLQKLHRVSHFYGENRAAWTMGKDLLPF